MDLPPPSVLAQLPRPLQASAGRTQVGEVFSLAESKKRKRYEVAVAVDGEGLNIYNVQSPKLITSHAVPPQSVFSCRPCAIRRRVQETSVVKRHIYAAVERPKHEIKGFFEETVPGSATAPVIATSSFTLKDTQSPTTFVGIIPRESNDDSNDELFDLLSVHRNGQVRRFTSDLKTQKWSIQHKEVKNEVSAAFLVEFDDARRSLLKKRPDLAALAIGDISASPANNPSVLLLVSHPGTKDRSYGLALDEVKVHIFAIPATYDSTTGIIDDFQKLRHLHTVQLPKVEGVEIDSKEPQWTFHSGSAGLSLSFEKGYINCDLSQYSPTVTSKFILNDEQFSSIMRISPYSVIGAGKSLVGLYDTHYSSVQRSISTRDLLPTKSKEFDPKAALTFVGYFAKLGIVLAVKDSALLAFDLSSTHTIRGTSLKRQRDGLLIDAIGRGVGSSASWNTVDAEDCFGFSSKEENSQWNTLKEELNSAIKATDAEAFDSAITSYFGTEKLLSLPQTSANLEKALFILSKIFTVGQQETEALRNESANFKIALWPKKTCDWLVKSGLFTLDHIDAAIRRAHKPRILPPFQMGSLVQALADFDASLKPLFLLLRSSAFLLSPEELTRALKVFIDLARTSSVALDQPDIMAITGAAADVDMDDDSSKPAATNDTNSNNDNNNNEKTNLSLQDAFAGLNLTLSKLHGYPISRVVSSLRSTLSNTDTLAIVHHLRVSLATGGYTARFTENPPLPLDAIKAAPRLSLDAIVDLMNASVDAIGPSGWVSAVEFAGAAVNESEMISHMQSEISAALAGVEEAAYMKGVLGEFIRYGNQVTTPSSNSKNKENNNMADKSSKPKAITATVAKDPAVGVKREYDAYGKLWETYTFPKAGEEDGKMLPLSLNAPGESGKISRTKIQKSTGAVQHRTNREMAYLQRRAVPDYSVVRINL
ncbi:WD repeat and HMG-box DNA-binding protein 1 [Talaromyces islandicus]|uniref:WD repeat and HMG-box DNA-binding protein 1 n=1 Tax=Talaromyces islandicus TaxID=28573 RepID=A0A0U1LPN1_TALIS|nr:WD repeat and HMG-box DNA-binding protein 1 [Talaromyces islandicus]